MTFDDEGQSSVLEKLLKYPVATTGLRGLTAMSALYFSRDYLRPKGNLLGNFLRTAKSLTRFKDIHDFTTSVLMIDDALDSKRGDVVLRAGIAEQGPDFCGFLKSSDICPPSYFATIRNLIDLGMTTELSAIAFSNLFAILSVERAKKELAAHISGDPNDRQELSDMNILTTQVYTVFVFRCINQLKSSNDNDKNLTVERALAPFPAVAPIAGLMQIMDDVRDVLIDLECEIANGVISPNAVATKLNIQGSLGSERSGNEAIRTFVEERSRCESPLVWSDAPSFLQDAFRATYQDFKLKAAAVPDALPRAIAMAMFKNSIQEGFKSGAHPAVARKAAIRAQQIAQLQAKYG